MWQGRFYSCPLDDLHLWKALRYVELNPVRAGLVVAAEQWPWSSARAHLIAYSDALLDMDPWRKRWSSEEWRCYLLDGASLGEVQMLRRYTHTGRPLGSSEFVASLEQSMARPLAARKGGRPKKSSTDSQQLALQVIA